MLKFIQNKLNSLLQAKVPSAPLRGKDLNRHFNTHGETCPDCGHHGFLDGPRGGLAVNSLCPNCGSEFNLSPFGGERISEPGQGRRKLYRARV